MEIFTLIILKLLPLYFFIFLGYVAGRFFHIESKQIGTLVIYVIMPFVFMFGLWGADIQASDLSIVAIIWMLSGIVAFLAYHLCGLIYKGKSSNLMASGLSSGNSGYFGIPVALILFDADVFGVYLLAAISNSMFQITVGYYLLALGKFKWQEALKKLVMLPPLYGAVAGLLLFALSVPLPEAVRDVSFTLKEAFVVLGMMIIGLTLSSFKTIKLDMKFISMAMFIRFMIWPLLAIGFISIDKTLLDGMFEPIHSIVVLFSLLPVGADFAIYAANLNLYPQRAATVVLISTLLAALIIPLVYAII